MKTINQKVQKISVLQMTLFITLCLSLLTVATFFLYSRLQNLIVSFATIEPEVSLTLNSSMEIFAYQMALVFFGVIALLPLSVYFTTKHYKSQLVPLNQQLDALLDGKLEVHRKMRAKDEFAPIMDKIHKFSDKLREQSTH